jgi:hypothetical protein
LTKTRNPPTGQKLRLRTKTRNVVYKAQAEAMWTIEVGNSTVCICVKRISLCSKTDVRKVRFAAAGRAAGIG